MQAARDTVGAASGALDGSAIQAKGALLDMALALTRDARTRLAGGRDSLSQVGRGPELQVTNDEAVPWRGAEEAFCGEGASALTTNPTS